MPLGIYRSYIAQDHRSPESGVECRVWAHAYAHARCVGHEPVGNA